MVAGRAVTPHENAGAMRLEEYWAFGEGAKKWRSSATPLRGMRGQPVSRK